MHFARGDKVTVVTYILFMRAHPKRRLHYRHVGPSSIEERIGKHNYRIKLPFTVRLHNVFHNNNLRPCSTTSLHHDVPVTTHVVSNTAYVLVADSYCKLL
jgi:hypothetical protein